MKNNVELITLGCRVNQYESCAICESLKKAGFSFKKDESAEFYIVNTCAVTAESSRKSRQIVRRCAKKGKVLVIGCASQLNDSFSEIDNVIYVGGNGNKMDVVEFLLNGCCEKKVNVISLNDVKYENININGNEDLFSECRAFIKIQDGCNGKCTYCIIPKCRGPVRSREMSEIVCETKRLIDNGYKEIILTGIEVSSYNKAPLQDLIKAVAATPGLIRLRLGSLSPNIINAKFLETIKSLSNFMPHIHLSLQSCSDKILTLMKRPYRKKDIYDRVNLIRQYMPNCMISADIIVGFPGETNDDFEETLESLKELKIFHIHSFPYSEREGTVATTMPNSVHKSTRSERNNRLISECNTVSESILDKYKDTIVSVLVEKIVNGYCYGHTEEFFEACFEHTTESVGDIVELVAVSNDKNTIKGRLYYGG